MFHCYHFSSRLFVYSTRRVYPSQSTDSLQANKPHSTKRVATLMNKSFHRSCTNTTGNSTFLDLKVNCQVSKLEWFEHPKSGCRPNSCPTRLPWTWPQTCSIGSKVAKPLAISCVLSVARSMPISLPFLSIPEHLPLPKWLCREADHVEIGYPNN